MRRASTAGIVEVGVGVRGMKILISSKLPEHASKHRASPSKLVHGRAQSTPSRNQPARLSTLYHPTPSTCSVAAQQDSPIRKSLGRLMTRVDFLMPAETPPASCRDIPPNNFFHTNPQSGCSTTSFTRQSSAKDVDLQRLWRIPPGSGPICYLAPRRCRNCVK